MTQGKRTLQEGYRAYMIEVDGRTQPEKIPFSARMGLFCGGFNSTYRARLEGSLSEKDLEKIEAFLAREADAHEQDLTHYYSQTARICAQLDALSGPDIGAAIARRDGDLSVGEETRRRDLMTSLLPAGRAAVQALLETEIAAKASIAAIDQVALWSEFPDELREKFRALCQFVPQEG